jgi:hypothetical protein
MTAGQLLAGQQCRLQKVKATSSHSACLRESLVDSSILDIHDLTTPLVDEGNDIIDAAQLLDETALLHDPRGVQCGSGDAPTHEKLLEVWAERLEVRIRPDWCSLCLAFVAPLDIA